jgi:hypothetical protein
MSNRRGTPYITHVTVELNGNRPYAAWTGADRISNKVLPTLTVILKTGGCRWNRCRMCSYRHVRLGVSGEENLERFLRAQVSWLKDRFPMENIDCVKIYTSGSFFDPVEVPLTARDAIGSLVRGKIVIAETRPEFVVPDQIASFCDIIDDGSHDPPLYVAMGLETINYFIREKCINKGFSCNDFLRASKGARSVGAGVKAYLLAKPPFLTERESIEDMVSSIRALQGIADMISLNPCSVQKGTELEYYWKRGEFRPPYLWSLLSILFRAEGHVLCDPLAGGRTRGAHNCGKCDRPILQGIRDYSLSGDRVILEGLLEMECTCKKEWEFVLENERPYCMPLTR